MEIGSYIATLTTASESPVLNELLTYVKPDEIQLYRQAFDQVALLLKKFIQNDAAKSGFSAEYLDRVVSAFSNNTTEQTKQRQVLEAILRYGIRQHQFSAAQIPQIFSVQRDLPSIGPLGLLHANPAFALYTLIIADLQYPKKLRKMQLEIGRLIAVLYLFECVQSLKDAAFIIRRYQLHYAGGAVFLIAPDNGECEQTRYVVQPYTAVLLQLLRQYERLDNCLEKVVISSSKALGYVRKYLACISQSDSGKVTLSLLRDYRKLYWTYYLGPVQASIILQRFKTTLLPTNIFVRTTSDKCLKITAVQVQSFNRSAFEKAHVAIKNQPARDRMVYQSVKQTEKLIRELLSFIKTPAKWSEDKNVEQSDKEITAPASKKSRQRIINLLLKRLQQAEAQHNFYVLLFGYYMVDLLRNGGVNKKVLSYRTIHDYVSAPLRAFLLVMNDFDMCKMDDEELTDKLNTVAQTMPATISNRLYYLALFIEKLELVDGFSASNIEVSTQTGKVNANVISVPQMERLLEYLHSLGEPYFDAIILLCLGFYAGCRRGEAQFIRVSDFEIVNASAGTQILCKIVPIYQRKLKSTAGTRSILLNVFWPERWLILLEQKLRFAVSSGVTRADLLFDDSIVTTFGTISDLLRRYLADEKFVFHNLRHSFVCWQFFRLMLAPHLLQRTGLKCFEDEYFSVASYQALKQRLGLVNVTRRLVFALRGLVGHDTPNITFSSYFHLRDVFTYLLLSTHLPLTQKALSCLVKGAKLDEVHLKEFPVEAVQFNNSFLRHACEIPALVNNSDYTPLVLPRVKVTELQLPTLKQLEQSTHFIGKLKTDENIKAIDGSTQVVVNGSLTHLFQRMCLQVKQQHKRPDTMPLLPIIPRSAGQLRADKKPSASRKTFERLMENAQQALDSGFLTDTTIVDGLSVLSGVLVNSLWELQVYEKSRCNAFLNVANKLIPEGIDISATLYDPDVSTDGDGNFLFDQWFMTLAQNDIKPKLLKMEPVYKDEFWSHKLANGVVHLHFVYTDPSLQETLQNAGNSENVRRTSVVMQFLHFLLIACKTRLEIKRLFTTR